MQKHPARRRWFAATSAMALVALGRPPSVTAKESPVVVADRSMLWIVQQGLELPDGETGVRLIHTPVGDWFSRYCRFPIRRGKVYCAAVVGGRLHAFFGDGTHYSFERTEDPPLAPGARAVQQRSLPGKFLPMGLAGDPVEGVLLAVVPVHIVVRIVEENERRDRLTAEDGEEDQPEPPGASDPDRAAESLDETSGRYWLVRYSQKRWEPVEALPEFIKPSGLPAMALDDTTLALCWRSGQLGSRTDLQCAQRVDGVWSGPQAVPGTAELANGVVGWSDAGLVWVGFRAAEGEGLPSEVVLLRDEAGTWVPSALRKADGTALAVPSDRAGLGMCEKQAVVVVAEGPEAVRWGLWPTDSEDPTGGLMAVPHLELPAETALSGRWVQIASYLCIVFLMTTVLWRRQSSVLKPADLPAGLGPAGLGRRSAGFFLDLLPAVVVTVPLWAGQFQTFMTAAMEYAGEPERVQPFMERLWLPTLLVRCVYAVYCLAWELWRGNTPGKMAVRSVACSVDGRPCSPRQVIVRNLFRIVELEPLLLVWPLLLLLVLTRNRQRLGDVWAGTLVIARLPLPPTPRRLNDTNDQ